MKKTDLAYIAGIIDGEGCIGIYKGKSGRKKKEYYHLQVVVRMTNEWIIRWLYFAFPGSFSEHTYPKEINRLKIWTWQLTGEKALIFLELIYPYLKLKKQQAEIAINFQKAKNIKNWATDEQIAINEAQKIMISNLKKECA